MNRSWYGLLFLAVLMPACQSAPKAPPASPGPPPELLRPYEGALRVLPHQGDVRALSLRPGERLTGGCDVAVRVRSVAFDRGEVRFALETIGQPRVGEGGVTCKRVEPRIQLALTGLRAGLVTPEVTARIDELLLTPEAYLRAKGAAFDRPPGEPPSEVASQLSDANDGERRLARGVVAWPRRLLSVDPTFRAPKGRARYERLVDFEAVVGTDGRLHRPRVRTSLDLAHESAVLSTLPLWRCEPARGADAPVGARIPLQLVLRVY
jgi:hypothetical protein